jgi:DNA-binding YbaB/EbfC family protein
VRTIKWIINFYIGIMMQFDIQKMMQQAKELQNNLEEARKKAETTEVTGEAGGGMVTVRMTGAGRLKAINIDPAIIDPADPNMLQDLIVAAVNKARKEADDAMSQSMSKSVPDLPFPMPNIPGFNF